MMKVKKIASTGLGVVISLTVVYFILSDFWVKKRDVEDISAEDNFKQLIKTDNSFLLFFTKPNDKLNQIWLEVADTVTKDYKGVNIAKFDCSIFKPICDGLGVQKYPSIVWMKNGKITKEYTGILDEELLKSFVFDIMTNTDNSDLSDNIDINKKPSENDDGMDMNKIENSIEKIEDYDPEQDFDNQVVLDPPESVKPDSSPGIKEINNLDISSKDKTDSNLNEEIILDDEIKNGEVQNNQEDNMNEAGLDEIVPIVDDNVGAENDARENEAKSNLNVELGDGDLNLDAKTIEVANDDYELQPEVGKADQPENVIEISIQSSSDTKGVLPQAKVPSFDVRAQNNAVQPDDQAVLKVPQIVPVSNFVTRKVVAPSNFTFKPRLVQTQQAVVNLVESSEQELFGEQKVESDSKASNSSSYSEEDDDNEYDDEDEKNNFDINKIVQELPLLPESKEIDSSSEPARIESLEASSDSEEESNENKSPEVEEQVGGTKVLDIAEMITDAKDDFFVEFTAKSFPRKVNKDGVTMLLMYADWCESCDKIRNTMIKLAHKHNKNSKILLGQIDCMKKRNEEFCLSQQMQGVPTVNAYRNGELLLANLIGYAPEEIEDCLISYLTDAGIQKWKERIAARANRRPTAAGVVRAVRTSPPRIPV